MVYSVIILLYFSCNYEIQYNMILFSRNTWHDFISMNYIENFILSLPDNFCYFGGYVHLEVFMSSFLLVLWCIWMCCAISVLMF